jgi:hypothetical protein
MTNPSIVDRIKWTSVRNLFRSKSGHYTFEALPSGPLPQHLLDKIFKTFRECSHLTQIHRKWGSYNSRLSRRRPRNMTAGTKGRSLSLRCKWGRRCTIRNHPYVLRLCCSERSPLRRAQWEERFTAICSTCFTVNYTQEKQICVLKTVYI